MHDTASRVAELLLRQDPPRDPLTGRLLKDLTPRALASVLEKYPCLRAVAPELPDPHVPRNWEVKGTFNGQRVISPEAAAIERSDPGREFSENRPGSQTLSRMTALLVRPAVTNVGISRRGL